jgi:hypothetical protein
MLLSHPMLLLLLLFLISPRRVAALASKGPSVKASKGLSVKASITSGSKRGKLAVVEPGQAFTLNVLVRKRFKSDPAVLVINAPDGALYQGPSNTLPWDPVEESQADGSSKLTWDLSAFPLKKIYLQIDMAADRCACPASLAFEIAVSENPLAGSTWGRTWGTGKARNDKRKSTRLTVHVNGGLSASQLAGINRALTAPCNIIGCDQCNDDASACLRCLDPTVWTLSNGTCGKCS